MRSEANLRSRDQKITHHRTHHTDENSTPPMRSEENNPPTPQLHPSQPRHHPSRSLLTLTFPLLKGIELRTLLILGRSATRWVPLGPPDTSTGRQRSRAVEVSGGPSGTQHTKSQVTAHKPASNTPGDDLHESEQIRANNKPIRAPLQDPRAPGAGHLPRPGPPPRHPADPRQPSNETDESDHGRQTPTRKDKSPGASTKVDTEKEDPRQRESTRAQLPRRATHPIRENRSTDSVSDPCTRKIEPRRAGISLAGPPEGPSNSSSVDRHTTQPAATFTIRTASILDTLDRSRNRSVQRRVDHRERRIRTPLTEQLHIGPKWKMA